VSGRRTDFSIHCLDTPQRTLQRALHLSLVLFHLEAFGPETPEIDPPILEAFIAEARVSL